MSKTEYAPTVLCHPDKLLEQDVAGMAYTVHRRCVRLYAALRMPKWRDVDPGTFDDWCKVVALSRRARKPLSSSTGRIVYSLVDVLKPHLH